MRRCLSDRVAAVDGPGMNELHSARRGPARSGRGEAGYTIIEVIVASFVLVVGMLGVLTMLSGALRTTSTTNKRTAATNLARELVETARGLDYDDLTDVTAKLQARGIGSGSPWTIVRRGVTYTVTATTCAFDDPSDGYATAAGTPANACNANAVGTDANGEDFRRVSFALNWNDGPVTRSLKQTTLIVDPAGGRPRILTITPLTQTITANVSSASILWTTTPAQNLRWDADDGASGGDVGGSNSFTTTWNIGIAGALLSQPTAGETLDGSYTIAATPSRDGIAGEGRRADIVLNRRVPYTPTGVAGGHDTRIAGGPWVDLEWSLNKERDILGYRVFWANTDANINGNDVQVCPASTAAILSKATKSCADLTSGPQQSGVQKYYVVAVDRDTAGALRDGEPASLNVTAEAATRLPKPTSITASKVAGVTTLTWSAVAGAAFYRIYRDGAVAYADRYDRTTGATASYTDSNPGAGSRTYWVTAVDSTFNESDPVGPKVVP
jgi:Tfp pilus assembly protein PilV